MQGYSWFWQRWDRHDPSFFRKFPKLSDSISQLLRICPVTRITVSIILIKQLFNDWDSQSQLNNSGSKIFFILQHKVIEIIKIFIKNKIKNKFAT